MNNDPVAIDLNVDAALLLKDLVGIDSYPSVLELFPNIYRIEDRDRVNAVVAAQLTEVGILDEDGAHPIVEHWLQCLYRPDTELVARIVDTESAAMRLLSLVRRGDSHVLAIRDGDHVVVQAVFNEGEHLDVLAAALSAALGPATAAGFESLTATLDQFAEVPADPAARRRALIDLGATPQTAAVITRALDEVTRRTEVLMIEHHDGVTPALELSMAVLDTGSGRIVVVPIRDLSGQPHAIYLPGDEAGLRAGIRALAELLPGHSWFDTSRT
ncbi:ESX secretion-associated protein EspG [Nocardia tengchongensis]|uniref:ESX secretion-associated protein EspG n=1 Tax=Nocardia tengchongensis TaxID=2055889 RepID=UPI0036CA5CE9